MIEEVLRIVDQGSPALTAVARAANQTKAAFSDADAWAKSWESTQRQAAAAADDWAASLRRGNRAGHDASDMFGKLGSGAAKSAGLLGAFDPAAGSAAMALNDVADAGEVATGAAAALGVSIGTLGVAALALGLIVAPLAGYFTILAREEAEADARTKFLAEHAHDLDGAMRDLEDSVLKAQVATGKLSDAQAHQLAIQDQANRAVQDFGKSQSTTRQAAEDAYFAAEQNKQWASSLLQLSPGLAEGVDALMGWSSTQEEAATTLDYLNQQTAKNQVLVVASAAADGEAAAATDKKTDADARATTAADAKTAAEKRAAAAAKVAAEAEAYQVKQLALLAKWADEAAQGHDLLVNAESELLALAQLGASEADKINAQAQERINKAMELLRVTQDQVTYEAALGAIETERVRLLNEAFNAQAQAATVSSTSAGKKAADTISGIASGPSGVVSMVGNAGPIGAIVAAILQLVDSIGDGLLEEMHAWVLDLIHTIGELPSLLMDFVRETTSEGPKAIMEMLPELLAGVISALIVEFPVAMLEAFAQFFTKDFWSGIGEAFVDAFSSIFSGDGSGGAAADTGRAGHGGRGGRVRGYATGTTYVPETTEYLLHEGEEVINSTGMGTERQEMARGRSTRSTVTGGPGGLRVLAEIEIDGDAYASAIAALRRQGHAV